MAMQCAEYVKHIALWICPKYPTWIVYTNRLSTQVFWNIFLYIVGGAKVTGYEARKQGIRDEEDEFFTIGVKGVPRQSIEIKVKRWAMAFHSSAVEVITSRSCWIDIQSLPLGMNGLKSLTWLVGIGYLDDEGSEWLRRKVGWAFGAYRGWTGHAGWRAFETKLSFFE